MSLNIHFHSHEDLRDAIAYEFYMDNVKDIIEGAGNDGVNISEAIKKLAIASYSIADTFLLAREESTQDNEPSTEES